MTGRSILVVEDDPTVAEVVVRYLERDGHDVCAVDDGIAALEAVRVEHPRLMVLDLMLPGLDGLEVCRRVRDVAPLPVVMLTARGEEEDRIAGFEIGADDYLAKPFSPRELVARVNAVLRRTEGDVAAADHEPIRVGDLVIAPGPRELTVAGKRVTITAKEFDLLEFLVRNPRRAFRREELLERVWGYTVGDTATVTVHIRRVREKIEEDPSAPRHLVTVWGVGYRFDP